MINIIHEPSGAEPFVVLEKSAGLPSAPLSAKIAGTDRAQPTPSHDTPRPAPDHTQTSALDQAARLFPEIKTVCGKKDALLSANSKNAREYGLLHRLDTATRGLLLIATSQEFYDYISAKQREGLFVKTYIAECDTDFDNGQKLGGFPAPPISPDELKLELAQAHSERPLSITSLFRAYNKGSREVRPVLETSSAIIKKKAGAKNYTTQLAIPTPTISYPAPDTPTAATTPKTFTTPPVAPFATIQCKITQGFRHQVRCHLAWIGLPVKGDEIYNFGFKTSLQSLQSAQSTQSKQTASLKFFAVGIEFPDPTTGRTHKFSLPEERLELSQDCSH